MAAILAYREAYMKCNQHF